MRPESKRKILAPTSNKALSDLSHPHVQLSICRARTLCQTYVTIRTAKKHLIEATERQNTSMASLKLPHCMSSASSSAEVFAGTVAKTYYSLKLTDDLRTACFTGSLMDSPCISGGNESFIRSLRSGRWDLDFSYSKTFAELTTRDNKP